METFRQFEAGPDPFGRNFQVQFKWLQTAIALRHSDTVDVKFVLTGADGARAEKAIALPHPELMQAAATLGRQVDDPWCARIAAAHLRHLVETGEDMEKDLVTVSPADIERYARELAAEEAAAVRGR